MKEKIQNIFIYTSWVPAGLFIYSYSYLANLDGWAQWSAGVIIIPSIILSAIYSIVGLVLSVNNYYKRVSMMTLLLCTLFSGSVAIWFSAKYIVHQIQMGFFNV